MKKGIYLYAILFMLLLAACGNQDTEQEGSEQPEVDGEQTEENAEVGGDLTVDLTSDAVSLDPHAANDGNSLYVMTAIYDNLVYLDKDLTIQPGLAESLEQIEDTIWEVKIRQDVTFHDGTPLNAEVVKANLDRVRDPDLGSPLGFLFDMIEEVREMDEYTVQIETEFPFASLPAHLAHPGGHIIGLQSIEADYEAIANGEPAFSYVNENPIGTGYFKYENRNVGESIELVKNENYWDVDAKVDSVTFKVVPEDFTRIAELETGDADIIYPVNPNDVTRLNEAENTKVVQSDSANITYLGFNTQVEPFNDRRVRQAITKAIDKEVLISGVVDGVALEAKGPLAPTVFGHNENLEPLSFELEEAKALLAEAGYEDGFSATILTNENRAFIDIAEYVQEQLASLGIEVEIQTAETGAYLETTGNGNSEMFIGSWGTVTLDADYGLYPMFHSSNAGMAGNRSFIDDPEIDSLLEQARQETDETKRLELYHEVQELLVEEAPIVYLYHSILLAGLRDEVEGFYQYPSSFLFLRDVTFNQ
ncbi:glutathione ABC transporter substrate-binding protein [Alkalihalobacillus trypoxylicola]|nr:glutathione ABC transporter substrate-binding protein [Alkalihalobacillus trypoxylicola]